MTNIRVHALDTGRVMIHRRQVEPYRIDALRLTATLLDRDWTPWLSVWSFAIEHPEGVVVVDAGQDPDYVRPWWDLYQQVAVRFDAGPADALSARLREAGIDPASVTHHVFTHLHVDHVGAGPLPGAQVILSEDEWRAAKRPGARMLGYMRPGIEDPVTVEDGHDLFGDGTIRLVATPGHTAGHQSVLVTPDDRPRVLIAGDAVYNEEALREGRIDGVAMSASKARRSIERLQDLGRETPTIIAPTHDVDAARRLAAAIPTELG